MEILNSVLQVKNLTKSFNGKKVLDDITFDVNEGEFISILGKSGCGKTTIFNLLIGLIAPDSGTIYKRGGDITNLDSSKRNIGVVFQNYALFPNMTALKNVAYPLIIKPKTRGTAMESAEKLISLMGLEEHKHKKPNKLSGGQQQRVAIARTLASNPDVMLFDEPMSALDVATRNMLRDEIKKIQAQFNITMVYITHDQEEAFTMSDRIIVMNEGKIEQFDTPLNIIKNPNSAFVKEFVTDQLTLKIQSLTKIMEGKC